MTMDEIKTISRTTIERRKPLRYGRFTASVGEPLMSAMKTECRRVGITLTAYVNLAIAEKMARDNGAECL